MKTVTLRGVEIGTGRPKIIVPIVASTQAGILEQAAELKTQPLHMVEWRVDFYDSALDLPQVLENLHKLREVLEDIPILFTFRTQNEGGKKLPEPEDYVSINTAAAQSGDADAIDVEIFSGNDVVRRCISAAHVSGTAVVGSNHDFEKTPAKSDLIYRLRKMQDSGADIAKIAVTPHSAADIITLLDATQEMHFCYAQCPIITMSMSDGVISRLCGEVFGSAMTFGMVGQASAPGQIPADQLQTVIDILHQVLHPEEEEEEEEGGNHA